MPLSMHKSSTDSSRLRRCIALSLFSALSISMLSGCTTLRNKISNGLAGNKSTPSSVISQEEALDPLGARSHRRLLWDDLTPSQLSRTIKSQFSGGEGQVTAQQSFATGKQLFERASQMVTSNPNGTQHVPIFVEAASHFRAASTGHPDSSLAEDALFLEGESFFFSDRYVQANRAFEGLITDYAGSRYLDRAEQRRYSIAVFWLDLKKSGASIALNDP